MFLCTRVQYFINWADSTSFFVDRQREFEINIKCTCYLIVISDYFRVRVSECHIPDCLLAPNAL